MNDHATLAVPRERLRDVGVGAYVRRRLKAIVQRLVFPVFRDFLSQLVTLQNKVATRCDVLGEGIESTTTVTRDDLLRLEERDELFYDALEERIRRLEERLPG